MNRDDAARAHDQYQIMVNFETEFSALLQRKEEEKFLRELEEESEKKIPTWKRKTI